MKIHTNSTWREKTLEDFEVVFSQLQHTKTPTLDTSLRLSNGEQIFSNTALFTLQKEIPPVSPVMLNKEGLLAAKSLLWKNPKKYKLKFQTLTDYHAAFPNHNIYLRTISTTQRHEDRRVVATEVLELIPVLLQRQKTTAKKLDIRLEKYRKRWSCAANTFVVFSTINMAELAAVLDDFDIDKSLLTLMPDICFAAQVGYQFHTRNVNASVCTINTHGMHAIHVSQAVFMLFNGVAMEVDWNTDIECKQHKMCNVASYRRKLLNQMNHYARMGERIFVKRQDLFHDMQLLKMCCHYKSREKRPFTPGLDLLYCDYSDKVRLSYLFIKCQEFGFKHIRNTTNLTIPALDAMYIPAWKARFVFMVLWMDMFFSNDEESEVLRKMVHQAISFKIPSLKWTEGCDPLELVFSSDPEVLRREKEIARRNAVDLFESSIDTEEKYAEITHSWFNERVVEKCLSNRNIIRCGKWSLQKTIHYGKSANRVLSDFKEQARKDFPKNYQIDEEMAIRANEALMKILVENRRLHATRPKTDESKAVLTHVIKIDKVQATRTTEGKVKVVMSNPLVQVVGNQKEKESEPGTAANSKPKSESQRPISKSTSEFLALVDIRKKNQQRMLRKVNALNEKAKRGIKTLRVSRQIRLIISDALKSYGACYLEMMRAQKEQDSKKDAKEH